VVNAAPGDWRLSVGPAIVDRGQRRKTLMNRGRFWIHHARRRRIQVYHLTTGECWEWRGSTWIKVTDANVGAA
jgi:hypothetical protein